MSLLWKPSWFFFFIKINNFSCDQVRGFVTVAEPYSGCTAITNPKDVQGHIALLQRGQCMFAEKARHIQMAGAIGGIVIGEWQQLGAHRNLDCPWSTLNYSETDVNKRSLIHCRMKNVMFIVHWESSTYIRLPLLQSNGSCSIFALRWNQHTLHKYLGPSPMLTQW